MAENTILQLSNKIREN